MNKSKELIQQFEDLYDLIINKSDEATVDEIDDIEKKVRVYDDVLGSYLQDSDDIKIREINVRIEHLYEVLDMKRIECSIDRFNETHSNFIGDLEITLDETFDILKQMYDVIENTNYGE